MPFYVSEEGEVLTFKILHPLQIELSNGAVLPDPPKQGQMFATEKSAKKYASLLKELKDVGKAKREHLKWVRMGAPDD